MRILFLVCAVACGCDGSPSPSGAADLAASGGGAGGGGGGDLAVSPCGTTGPFGSFTMVHGGQSGVTACGHMFSSFTGATITLAQSDGGSESLTVTGTGTIGDTMNCPAVVDSCNVTATACPTGAGSTISYTLMTFTHQLTGTAQPQIPGPGGGCSFTYNVDGTR
jgi:hypothetical protein